MPKTNVNTTGSITDVAEERLVGNDNLNIAYRHSSMSVVTFGLSSVFVIAGGETRVDPFGL